MDQNEMIALGIVALAALLSLRYFLKKRGNGCCGSGCQPHLQAPSKKEKTGDRTK